MKLSFHGANRSVTGYTFPIDQTPAAVQLGSNARTDVFTVVTLMADYGAKEVIRRQLANWPVRWKAAVEPSAMADALI